MSESQMFIVRSSNEDNEEKKENVDRNLVEITKYVKDAEIYMSTSQSYINASKQSIQDLKSAIVFAEADINTAEECMMKSERKLQDLKKELQIVFNKTFYKNFASTREESITSNPEETSSIISDDNFYEKIDEILQNYAQDKHLDTKNYFITCQSYRGLTFVVMESRLMDDRLSESLKDSTSDSDSENESLTDNGHLPQVSLRDKGTPTQPLIEMVDSDDNESIRMRNDKVFLDESDWPALGVEPAEKRSKVRQSISQSFLKAKLSETKSLMQNVKDEPNDERNDFLPHWVKIKNNNMDLEQNDFLPPWVKIKNNEMGDLEEHCNQKPSTSKLDKMIMANIPRKDNLASNRSNTSSRLNLAKFTNKDSGSNLGDSSNETSNIAKKCANNSPKHIYRSSLTKSKRPIRQTQKHDDQNLTPLNRMSNFSSETFRTGVNQVNSIETPPSNSSAKSKTLLPKSASQSNLIEFSPNFGNRTCSLKKGPLTDKTVYPGRREYSYSEKIDFSKKATNSDSISASSDTKRQTGKSETFSRFKSIDNSGFHSHDNELRSYRSENLLVSLGENSKEAYRSDNLPVRPNNTFKRKTRLKNVKNNQTFSLPRVSRGLEKQDQSAFRPILDTEETNQSEVNDSLASPNFDRSYSRSREIPCRRSTIEGAHCSNYDTNTSKTPDISGTDIFRGNGTDNFDDSAAEIFGHELNQTQPLSFPNGDIFSSLNSSLSASIRAQVSDHSINDRSISLNENYMVNYVVNHSAEETYCYGGLRNMTGSFGTASDASNVLEKSYDAEGSPQSTSEFYAIRRPFPNIPSTECQSKGSHRSSFPTKESFNPRFDSCSSPAPDYSP